MYRVRDHCYVDPWMICTLIKWFRNATHYICVNVEMCRYAFCLFQFVCGASIQLFYEFKVARPHIQMYDTVQCAQFGRKAVWEWYWFTIFFYSLQHLVNTEIWYSDFATFSCFDFLFILTFYFIFDCIRFIAHKFNNKMQPKAN